MLSEVVIVGGGLTGLAAAWELEQIGLPYTLIEVKARLGGSILTERHAGFVVDGGPFIHEKYGEWPFLEPLGLADSLRVVGRYRDGELVIFKAGTQALTEALAARLRGTILKRMAVSSLGLLDGRGGTRFGICLENGLLLDAHAVIITAPARYAEHMIRSLHPEAALRLLDYRYDAVVRVALGFHRAALPEAILARRPAFIPPADDRIRFLQLCDLADRVPAGMVLVRAGVRVDDAPAAAELLARVRSAVAPAGEPVFDWLYYWPEADPLTVHLPEHADNMAAIAALLPPRVVLAGSDYDGTRLDQRIEAGRAAARRIAAAL